MSGVQIPSRPFSSDFHPATRFNSSGACRAKLRGNPRDVFAQVFKSPQGIEPGPSRPSVRWNPRAMVLFLTGRK